MRRRAVDAVLVLVLAALVVIPTSRSGALVSALAGVVVACALVVRGERFTR